MPDGSTLSLDKITLSSGDISGTNEGELLHGSASNNTISGNGGIDLLFGGDGNDTIQGGSGDDFIYGGAGNDLLNGGAGGDYLKGNSGADYFVFDILDGQTNIIADFEVEVDKLILAGEAKALVSGSASQVVSMATYDGQDLNINLTGGTTITLIGINSADFSTVDVIFG